MEIDFLLQFVIATVRVTEGLSY